MSVLLFEQFRQDKTFYVLEESQPTEIWPRHVVRAHMLPDVGDVFKRFKHSYSHCDTIRKDINTWTSIHPGTQTQTGRIISSFKTVNEMTVTSGECTTGSQPFALFRTSTSTTRSTHTTTSTGGRSCEGLPNCELSIAMLK